MRLDIFKTRPDAHIRRAQEYLQQANMARIEHQTAAEHHAALASMYEKRIVWLEREIADAMNNGLLPLRGMAGGPLFGSNKSIEAIKRGSESILSLARSPRSVRPSVEDAA
jgi:hypothetical protein